MANWKRTINIKPVIQDNSLTMLQKAERIKELLKDEPEFEDAVERLIDAGQDEESGALAPRHAQQDFNEALSEIYDIADDMLIWMGL